MPNMFLIILKVPLGVAGGLSSGTTGCIGDSGDCSSNIPASRCWLRGDWIMTVVSISLHRHVDFFEDSIYISAFFLFLILEILCFCSSQ